MCRLRVLRTTHSSGDATLTRARFALLAGARWQGRADWRSVCERYAVGAEGGFLPEACVERLEAEELQPWER